MQVLLLLYLHLFSNPSKQLLNKHFFGAGLSNLSSHLVLENSAERVGVELVPAALVELVLEFDPVKSERVQEALHGVHAHQHAEGNGEERKERQEQLYKDKSIK
jgi:hypothetical protein